ncbi:MAG: acetylornithine deacetylase [Hyphomicrobiales bacterium]|nr:acetylornithine deacetylase [Hyphomicrobiales bacterium]
MAAVPTTPEELLARLVGFDTTSAKSNLALIDFVRAYLRGHGVDSELIPNEDATKANLYATVGPREPGGIALSGHTDVVPADAQAWQTDPFTLSARDGRLHGRGSADMKGFLACVLSLVPEMVAARLATPIHLAFSYDEEIGCGGVRPMLEAMGAGLPKPRLAIVGEPTMMQVVNAHKSIQEFVTEVTGFEAHSSMTHLGANAIFATAEIIGEIARIRDELIVAGDPSGRFTPPHSSIEVGCISGGTAINIVPRHCRLHWEMRGLPGVDPAAVLERVERFGRETVLPKLRAVSKETDIGTRLGVNVPALAPGTDEPAEKLALRLTDRNDTLAVSYGTEAGLFRRAGIPTVVCGPGDIAVAHRPDEYIEKDQLAACTRFLRRLIETAR